MKYFRRSHSTTWRLIFLTISHRRTIRIHRLWWRMPWYSDWIEREKFFPFQSNLPLNVSDRATQLAQTMMNGNVDKSINDWYNDIKDEQTYNDMVHHPSSYYSLSTFQIGNTNGSGPVQTFVGCSKVDINYWLIIPWQSPIKNAARAICTRSISDLDSSLYSYIFNSAVYDDYSIRPTKVIPFFSPNEIAWQCPDKDYYCCEWECCKEKKWSVAGIM